MLPTQGHKISLLLILNLKIHEHGKGHKGELVHMHGPGAGRRTGLQPSLLWARISLFLLLL
jgi:hypothetical protein